MQHRLQIRNYKTSHGFRAACSCGKKIWSVSGCNWSGRRDAMVEARERMAQHLSALGLLASLTCPKCGAATTATEVCEPEHGAYMNCPTCASRRWLPIGEAVVRAAANA